MLLLYSLSAGLTFGQVVLFVCLHVWGSNHRLHQPVSDYGTGRVRRLFGVYVLTGCLAVSSLGVAVIASPTIPMRAGVYLLCLAALRLGVLRFPTDVGEMARTRTGRLHLLFAVASFALVYMAVDVLHAVAPAMVDASAVSWLVGLHLIATIALVATVATMLPALQGAFGFAERALLLSTMIWLGLFALAVR